MGHSPTQSDLTICLLHSNSIISGKGMGVGMGAHLAMSEGGTASRSTYFPALDKRFHCVTVSHSSFFVLLGCIFLLLKITRCFSIETLSHCCCASVFCLSAGTAKGKNSSALCRECSRGYYTLDIGQTSCTECPVDHYCSVRLLGVFLY